MTRKFTRGSLDERQNTSSRLETLLAGLNFKYRVSWFDKIDSSSDFALKLNDPDGLHGRLVIANSQSKGRGRHGRNWLNQEGKDLLFSLILVPQVPNSMWHLLTFVFGVSICKALRSSYNLNAELRWPNDVLVEDRKVCGILLDARPDRLVVGVGVNVNSEKVSENQELIKPATSLKDVVGYSVNRYRLLNSILKNFEELYSDFEGAKTERLADIVRDWMGTIGRSVEANQGGELIQGTAIDLTEAGSLVIRTDFGTVVEINSGDVFEITHT